MFAEYMSVETWFSIIAFQAVVHYVFIKSETYLLVVKEDLIMTTVWISSLGCAAGTTFVKFNGNFVFEGIVMKPVYRLFKSLSRVDPFD